MPKSVASARIQPSVEREDAERLRRQSPRGHDRDGEHHALACEIGERLVHDKPGAA